MHVEMGCWSRGCWDLSGAQKMKQNMSHEMKKVFFLMKVALAQVRLKEVAIDQYMIR